MFRSHHLRRGGYLKPTASSTTRATTQTPRRTPFSGAGYSSTGIAGTHPGAPGARSAGLGILPLHPERSRSTGGGLSGTTSPLITGPSTGDPGQPPAGVGSETVREALRATGMTDRRIDDLERLRAEAPPNWRPSYGTVPAWMPSDELVSDNGRDWYPEPRDAA